MVKNAGIPSLKSLKSMLCTLKIIRAPSNIKAGAVAALGMIMNNELKNKDAKKRIPVVTAVNPVLPPALIPTIDSRYSVNVGDPKNAPKQDPIESTNIALPIIRLLSGLSKIPALLVVEISVPKVSINPTKTKVKIIENIPMFNAPFISNAPIFKFAKMAIQNEYHEY